MKRLKYTYSLATLVFSSLLLSSNFVSGQIMYVCIQTTYTDPCAFTNPFCIYDPVTHMYDIPCCVPGSKTAGAIYRVDLSTCTKTLVVPPNVGSTATPIFFDMA